MAAPGATTPVRPFLSLTLPSTRPQDRGLRNSNLFSDGTQAATLSLEPLDFRLWHHHGTGPQSLHCCWFTMLRGANARCLNGIGDTGDAKLHNGHPLKKLPN